MSGMLIAAMIFAMLAQAVLLTLFALRLAKTKHWVDIVIVSSLGLMILGSLFIAILNRVTVIMGGIFWILAWPGLAAGFVFDQLELVKSTGKAIAAQQAQPSDQNPPAENP
jgi:hypothetical protein